MSDAGDEVRIVQISDTHLTREGRTAYRVVDTAARFETAVAAVAEYAAQVGGVDAVVVTGDLTQFGRAEEYERFRLRLAPLPGPVFLLPGNHDKRDALREAFPDHDYLSRSGALDFVVRVGPVHLVGLDSLVEAKPYGALELASLQRAADALDAAGGAPVVVALHHPPQTTGVPDVDREIVLGGDVLMQRLSVHPGPRLTICGHAHRRLSLKSQAGPIEIAPPTFPAMLPERRRPGARAAPDYRPHPAAFLVHRWSAECGFETETVAIGDVSKEPDEALPRFG